MLAILRVLYAIPTHHLTVTHLPPRHTIVIKADIFSTSKDKRHVKGDSVIHHRIITTCGDDNVKHGTQKRDTAPYLYVGTYLMCVLLNEFLREKVPRGNGTLCRLVSMNLKESALSHQCKNCYSQKVCTVCAPDVEWIKVEHVVKTEPMADVVKEMERLQISLSAAPGESAKCDLE